MRGSFQVRRASRTIARGIAALVCAGAAAAAEQPASPGADTPQGAPSADARRLATLDALHDGRFDNAERLIAPLAAAPDAAAGDALLHAFVTYWRTLYDPDNRALQDELDARLDRTIEIAGAALDEERSGEVVLWKGSAHMLRAQLRAAQRKIFSAAFEAKKAKKLLEQAVEQGSLAAESDFGLGTYQYYAAMLPAVVKGLRALLFIPGGNRAEGLERLHRASRESRWFGLESRIVLANIYADDKERMYAEAEAVVAEALQHFPDTVAALHAAARLDLALNRPAAALEHLLRALETTRAHPDTATSVSLTLRYYAGAAEYERFRPDLALEWWQPILVAPQQAPEPVVRRVQRGAAVLLLVPDRPAWTSAIPLESLQQPTDDARELVALRAAGVALERARPALERERAGDDASAAALLDALVAEHPDDPVTALLAGRARLRSGRGNEALPLLRDAVEADGLPATYAGVARLFAGMAADAAGAREAALAWYREAEHKHRFLGRDAARLYQATPYVERSGAPRPEPVARQ